MLKQSWVFCYVFSKAFVKFWDTQKGVEYISLCNNIQNGPFRLFKTYIYFWGVEYYLLCSKCNNLCGYFRKVSGISSSSIGGGADKHRSGGGFIPSPSSSSSTLVAGPAQTQQHLVASAPRLMFPRCANENDMGAVEVARRESQHFLRNTDLIVSQRDEIRQHSKDLVAQVSEQII